MLIFLVIGVIAGWLVDRIVTGREFWLIGDLVVGVVGSISGGYLSEILGLSSQGAIGGIIMATLGAAVLLWITRYLYSLIILYIYKQIELS